MAVRISIVLLIQRTSTKITEMGANECERDLYRQTLPGDKLAWVISLPVHNAGEKNATRSLDTDGTATAC